MLPSEELRCPLVMAETRLLMIETCCEAGSRQKRSFIGAKGWGSGRRSLASWARVSEPSAFPAGHLRGASSRAARRAWTALAGARSVSATGTARAADPGRPPGLGPACGDHRGPGWLLSWGTSVSQAEERSLFPCRVSRRHAAGSALAPRL